MANDRVAMTGDTGRSNVADATVNGEDHEFFGDEERDASQWHDDGQTPVTLCTRLKKKHYATMTLYVTTLYVTQHNRPF